MDLWDYLEEGDAGTHTLSVFYTERGASGSTCWIQFTLPGVFDAVEADPALSDRDYHLPDTGGIGTTSAYAIGGMLALAGCAALAGVRKRKETDQDE